MAQGRLVFPAMAFSIIPPKRLLNSSILLPPTGATDCVSQPTAGTPVFLFMKSGEREMPRIVPSKVSFPVVVAAKLKSLFGSNWYQTLTFFARLKKFYIILYITVKFLIMVRDPKTFVHTVNRSFLSSHTRTIFWLLFQLYWFLVMFLLRFVAYIISERNVYIVSCTYMTTFNLHCKHESYWVHKHGA